MRRRSSLLLGQQALADGVIKDPREINEMIRKVSLPRPSLDNARQSDTRSITRSKSKIPTSDQKRSAMRKSISMDSVSRVPSVAKNVRQSGVKSILKSNTKAPTSGPRTSGAMRRYKSMESVSLMQTPCATPCTNRGGASSVASAPYTGPRSDRKDGLVVKNLKPPPYQDKKSLNDMFMNILEFLERHEYQFERQIKVATAMTNSEYALMTRFVLQLWMGKHFLAGIKTCDLPKKFLELSVQMKYPGTLNKAILMSPNVPHQLPPALTFLAWLVCMTERSLTPPEDERRLTELVAPEKYIYDLAKESCLRLFFQEISTGAPAVDEELERYRSTVFEVYGFGDNTTREKLLRTRDEKRQELESKAQLSDPRKEILLTIDDNTKRARECERKEEELTELHDKISDIDKILNEAATLKERLKTMEDTLESLTRQTLRQQMSKLEERQILMEIEDFKKQRDTVEQVNSGMLLQLQKREQLLSNLNARFFETCTRLSVCDIFNDLLHRLELLRMLEDMERIPKNPFTPIGLKDWLKSVIRIKKTTQNVLGKLDLLLMTRYESSAALNLEQEEAEAAHVRISQEVELEMESSGMQENNFLKQMDSELFAVMDAIESVTEDINEWDNLQADGDDEIKAIQVRITKAQAKEYTKSAELDKWATKAENLKQELMELEVYCKDEVAKRMAYYTERWNKTLFSDTTETQVEDLNE